MATNQGSATFGGVVGLNECRFLLTRGTKPSRGMLATPILDQIAPPIGDLVIHYASEGPVTITLRGCAVAEAYVERSGRPQLVIWIEDRRWKWEFTEIVGRYNVRESQAEDEVKYEKTPQELIALLAAAMGEKILATALPNDARPYVNWRNSRCDVELANLLADLGCDIVPNLFFDPDETDDEEENYYQWFIVKVGEGELLPTTTIEHAGAGVTSPKTPERIRAIGGNVRYQCRFLCEAVALDVDGKYDALNDVSYKPGAGWGDEDPEILDGVTGTYEHPTTGDELQNQDLALSTVYRDYRIASVIDGGGPDSLDPPGFVDVAEDPEADPPVEGAPHITEISQLLPLLPTLNTTYLDGDDKRKPHRPYAYGQWFADYVGERENGSDVVDADGNITNGFMPNGFSIDLETGVVSFARPMVKMTDGKFGPATIILVAVCEADWIGLNTKIYYALSDDKDGVVDPQRVQCTHVPEAVLKYREVWDDVAEEIDLVDNKAEVDAELGYYLAALANSFIDQVAATGSYRNLLLLNLDGAIEQVEWIIGGGGTQTRLARNTQLYPYLATYKDAVRQAKLDEALAKAATVAEIKPADLFGAG